MKYDLKILEEYITNGYLTKQYHWKLPLTIWNYTRKTQFEKKWDEITLSCRGLVLDNEGNIIARPFKKFFNMEELDPNDIPIGDYDVYEKMDGSLGILFNYEGEWIIASRGSFASDQAIKAKELLKKYDLNALIPKLSFVGSYDNSYSSDTSLTYILEIIYPENRIVVNYGEEEKLTLLGVICNNDGHSLPYNDLKFLSNISGFDLVKKYAPLNFTYLKENVADNSEGYVIKFHNSEFRMKIKGNEYCRLHSLVTNCSNVDIWECLKNGNDIEQFLDRVPDEFDNWVRDNINDLKNRFDSEYIKIEEEYNEFIKPFRKLIADQINQMPVEKRRYFFALFDHKDISKTIWNKIRPVYQKPFWQQQTEE